jgi:hypothetical protein
MASQTSSDVAFGVFIGLWLFVLSCAVIGLALLASIEFWMHRS